MQSVKKGKSINYRFYREGKPGCNFPKMMFRKSPWIQIFRKAQ